MGEDLPRWGRLVCLEKEKSAWGGGGLPREKEGLLRGRQGLPRERRVSLEGIRGLPKGEEGSA